MYCVRNLSGKPCPNIFLKKISYSRHHRNGVSDGIVVGLSDVIVVVLVTS